MNKRQTGMTVRPARHVLVVDDMSYICDDLRDTFLAHNRKPDGKYQFDVDIATTIEEAIDKVRARPVTDQYHVIVLDLSFAPADENNRDGLRVSDALGLCLRFGQTIPVEIIFSGYAGLKDCVQAMRHGAWDVINKLEDEDGDPYDRVVASAVARLMSLDLQEHLATVAVAYLQRRIATLQRQFGGQVIAIWHEPEVGVIAHGRDAFDLEQQLVSWRATHAEWMYPFVTQIPELALGMRHGGAP